MRTLLLHAIVAGPLRLMPFRSVSGGADSSFRVDNATSLIERKKLSARLNNFASSNCAKVIGAVFKQQTGATFNATQFTVAAANLSFYDATASGVSNWTQDQVSGNGNGKTLAASIGNSDAITITNGTNPAVVLGQRFFQLQNNAIYAGNTLFHESLHAFTSWNDSQIYSLFKQYGLTQYSSLNTESISAWLSTDCKSTPGYLDWNKTISK